MTNNRSVTSTIPKPAWAIAAIAFLCGYLIMTYLAIPSDPHAVQWPQGGKLLLSILAPLVAAVWVLLIGYVYGDSKRRLMRPWLWTLLAVFIPNTIGIILYFILRDPLPFYCSHCGTSVKNAFTFCPNCASPLRLTCPQCGRGLERAWAHCPHCGAATPVGKQGAPTSASPAPGPV